MFRKLRRFLLITALVVVVALVFAAVAFAATVSPHSQTGQGGIYVNWTGSWSGTSPFDVTFTYGDGSAAPAQNGVSYTSSPYSHPFYPCFETSYTQTLKVADHLGLKSSDQSLTIVNPGSIC